MDEFDDFEIVFSFKSDYAFDHKIVEAILANRRALENELFFDRLLRVLGIRQAKKLYPPRSNQDLRTLHREIISSASADHHKLSLLYYVLKDCVQFPHASEKFAERYYIPDKYRTYIQGLWHLDRLKFERALSFLTEPSLIPTFPEEILYTLCVHAVRQDITLPIAYYYTVAPPLTSVKILDVFFSVLCRSSITEAFYFSRGHTDEVHRHLLEQLVGFVHSGVSGETRSERGVELVNLPLNEEEEHWFEEYLLSGKGRTLQGSKDTVTMRRVAIGKVTEAFQDNAGSNRGQLHGLNWDVLRGGLEKGAGPRLALRNLSIEWMMNGVDLAS